MKIDTLKSLNGFLKKRMKEHDISLGIGNGIAVYEFDGKIKVDLDSTNLTIDSIIFLGNCLKKFKDDVLYSEADF